MLHVGLGMVMRHGAARWRAAWEPGVAKGCLSGNSPDAVRLPTAHGTRVRLPQPRRYGRTGKWLTLACVRSHSQNSMEGWAEFLQDMQHYYQVGLQGGKVGPGRGTNG